MSDLKYDTLSDMSEESPEMRQRIVRECVVVLDGEVSRKRGASGLIIKGGFKVVKGLKSGAMIESLIDMLLDEFIESLDPFYEEWSEMDAGTRGSFSSFLNSDSDAVANALLGVTDSRRQRATTKSLIKIYDKLRPTALKHVEEGVPAVGSMVERYL